ncbi:hypothetical protein HK097_001483, partial [Rhizophlyctis rosea]
MAPIILKIKGTENDFSSFANLDKSEDYCRAWKTCTKVKDTLENGNRLENLSWRLWHLHSMMVESKKMNQKQFKKLSTATTKKLEETPEAMSPRTKPIPMGVSNRSNTIATSAAVASRRVVEARKASIVLDENVGEENVRDALPAEISSPLPLPFDSTVKSYADFQSAFNSAQSEAAANNAASYASDSFGSFMTPEELDQLYSFAGSKNLLQGLDMDGMVIPNIFDGQVVGGGGGVSGMDMEVSGWGAEADEMQYDGGAITISMSGNASTTSTYSTAASVTQPSEVPASMPNMQRANTFDGSMWNASMSGRVVDPLPQPQPQQAWSASSVNSIIIPQASDYFNASQAVHRDIVPVQSLSTDILPNSLGSRVTPAPISSNMVIPQPVRATAHPTPNPVSINADALGKMTLPELYQLQNQLQHAPVFNGSASFLPQQRSVVTTQPVQTRPLGRSHSYNNLSDALRAQVAVPPRPVRSQQPTRPAASVVGEVVPSRKPVVERS